MPPFVEKGTVHGKIWFDPELGFPRATVSDQLLTMKTPARARGTNAVPKLISVTVRQHSNLKLLEVSPLGPTP